MYWKSHALGKHLQTLSSCSCKVREHCFQNMSRSCLSLELLSDSLIHTATGRLGHLTPSFEFRLHCTMEMRLFEHAMQNSEYGFVCHAHLEIGKEQRSAMCTLRKPSRDHRSVHKSRWIPFLIGNWGHVVLHLTDRPLTSSLHALLLLHLFPAKVCGK